MLCPLNIFSIQSFTDGAPQMCGVQGGVSSHLPNAAVDAEARVREGNGQSQTRRPNAKSGPLNTFVSRDHSFSEPIFSNHLHVIDCKYTRRMSLPLHTSATAARASSDR